MTLTSAVIKAKARDLGFDACGIAAAIDHAELPFFSDWVARGYAASMTYLERSADRRADVRQILPSAQAVIATATVYNTDRPYSIECTDPERAHIARYAWGDDYHEVIARRLDAFLLWLRESTPEPFEALAYVDTGPVQERVYARHAGLGWIGKNTCVIHPELGSWIFLAEIVCSLPLEADAPSYDQCGTCTLCLEACPTQAFPAPGVLDANRCISYLTIEHRGEIPEALGQQAGTHVFGCDICQEVCPWNARAPVSVDRAWQPRPVWAATTVSGLEALSEDEMLRSLKGSAMKRTKISGMRRNIAMAKSNAALGVVP